MSSVGNGCIGLIGSDALVKCLQEAGKIFQFPDKHLLFRAGEPGLGVFLVRDGEVCLHMENMPHLDRFCGAGALLGLPATFTGNSYSLSATCSTASEVVLIPKEKFLRLMREKPELCREATDILGRELAFIQSALAKKLDRAAR